MSDPETDAAERAVSDDGDATDAPTPTSDRRTVRLKWSPAAAAEIRGILVEDLTTRGVGDQSIDEAELVASELVGNAIRHASPLQDGTVRIHWKVKGNIVEIEVTDGGGRGAPKVAPPSALAPSGRGLRIVRAVAHEWGIIEEANGYTVWACMGGPSRRRTQ